MEGVRKPDEGTNSEVNPEAVPAPTAEEEKLSKK